MKRAHRLIEIATPLALFFQRARFVSRRIGRGLQELQALEATVITGSKIPKTVSELTHSVSVVDETRIDSESYTDVSEILRKLVGVEFTKWWPGTVQLIENEGMTSRNILIVLKVKINVPVPADTRNLLSQLIPRVLRASRSSEDPRPPFTDRIISGVISITTKSGKTKSRNVGGELGSLGWIKVYGSYRDTQSVGEGDLLYSINVSDTERTIPLSTSFLKIGHCKVRSAT